MRWVTVRHPETGGTARITEPALPYHLRAGWELAPAPEPGPPSVTGETAAGSDGTPAGPPSTDVPPPGGPQETGSES